MTSLFDVGPEMRITAIAPWFGGKRTLAPVIVRELGKHSAYWEPFCGSLAVLLNKPASSHETINDLNRDLINLARVIADADLVGKFYGRLHSIFFDEERRAESLRLLEIPDLSPVERAMHYFIVNWFGRNGFSGTVGADKSSFAVRWTPGGGHGGQRFASAVDSIPAWHERLRRATILCRDAFELIDSISDEPRVCIYCDPPYLVKAAKYIHDFTEADHKRLAVALSRFKHARVVVSYYRDPRLEILYPKDKWNHRDCSISKGLHNAGRRGSEAKEAPEVLIINGTSYAEEMTK